MKIETLVYTARVHSTGGWKNILMKHPLLHLVTISLLAVSATPTTTWAQVKAAPPLSGVFGTVQPVTGSSLEVMTKSSVVQFNISQPLTRYKQERSDLSYVTSTSYAGVASVEQADGTERAAQILIFPPELHGAAEQCHYRHGSGHNDSQQNWLRLPPCRNALKDDEPHGAERGRHDPGGSLSGRRADDLRTYKCTGYGSGAGSSHVSSRRSYLCGN
jgi:hypothetical protein